MAVTTETIHDVLVVAWPGEYLDASNSKQFKLDIQEVVKGSTKLVLDMTPVQFVDSSGCGAILTCLRQVNSGGGDLKLCGVSRQVRALFELVRMHRIVEIYNTKDEAVNSFLK